MGKKRHCHSKVHFTLRSSFFFAVMPYSVTVSTLCAIHMMFDVAHADTRTNRLQAAESYMDIFLPASKKMYDEYYRDMMSQCSNGVCNDEKKIKEMKSGLAYIADLKAYFFAKCLEKHLNDGGDLSTYISQFSSTSDGDCNQNMRDAAMKVRYLIPDLPASRYDQILYCAAISRLVKDEDDFPIHPELRAVIDNDVWVRRFDYKVFSDCLTS